MPIVTRMGTGRMNVPNRPQTPRRPLRPEAEAKMSRESITPPTGKQVPRRKTLSDWQPWKAIGQTRLCSTKPPGPYGLNEDGGHPTDLMVDTGVEQSVVTQPVGSLSQKHATIIRATGNKPTNAS
jgi:hypothetical protein